MIFPVKTSTVAPNNAGFTLLEMVVVLALMSLVTAAAALSLKVPLQNARLKAAIAKLEDVDRRARLAARRSASPVSLQFTAGSGIVVQTAVQNGRKIESTYSVGTNSIRLERLLMPGNPSGSRVARVDYSPEGQSATYALQLQAGSGRKMWLLVVGAAGQYVRSSDDEMVESLVSTQK